MAPLEELHSSILNRITQTRFFVEKAKNVVRNPKLNALVDQWPRLIKGPYPEEEENQLERQMEEYKSSDKKVGLMDFLVGKSHSIRGFDRRSVRPSVSNVLRKTAKTGIIQVNSRQFGICATIGRVFV